MQEIDLLYQPLILVSVPQCVPGCFQTLFHIQLHLLLVRNVHGNGSESETVVFNPVFVCLGFHGLRRCSSFSKNVAEEAIDGEIMAHISAPLLVIRLQFIKFLAGEDSVGARKCDG